MISLHFSDTSLFVLADPRHRNLHAFSRNRRAFPLAGAFLLSVALRWKVNSVKHDTPASLHFLLSTPRCSSALHFVAMLTFVGTFCKETLAFHAGAGSQLARLSRPTFSRSPSLPRRTLGTRDGHFNLPEEPPHRSSTSASDLINCRFEHVAEEDSTPVSGVSSSSCMQSVVIALHNLVSYPSISFHFSGTSLLFFPQIATHGIPRLPKELNILLIRFGKNMV